VRLGTPNGVLPRGQLALQQAAGPVPWQAVPSAWGGQLQGKFPRGAGRPGVA